MTRLILGCSLLMFVAACSKCGSSSPKGDYIAKLDARCTAVKGEAEEMKQKAHDAEAKNDLDAIAKLMRESITKREAMTAELKAMPQPAEDAEALKTFWAENEAANVAASKLTEALLHMSELNKQLAAAPAPAEGAEPQGPSAETIKTAEAAVMQANQDLISQAMKVDAAARHYGFAVCGLAPPGMPKQ